jgi:hypothetical protein
LVETTPDIIVNKGNWAVDELLMFYEYCLGQDADAIFLKITMSSNKCWKGVRVGSLFLPPQES